MLQNSYGTFYGSNEAVYGKFGEGLKLIRRELKLTQADVAELAEIPRTRYSEYENSKRLPTDKVYDRLTASLRTLGVDNESLTALTERREKAINAANNFTVGRIRRTAP